MRPNSLLNSQQPSSPKIFIDTNPFHILDLDFMERPITRNLHLDFQVVVIDEIRSHHFVDRSRYFNGEVTVDELAHLFGLLDVRQLILDDDRSEVLRRVRDDARRKLAISAIEDPVVYEGWQRYECPIIEMCGENGNTKGRTRFIVLIEVGSTNRREQKQKQLTVNIKLINTPNVELECLGNALVQPQDAK